MKTLVYDDVLADLKQIVNNAGQDHHAECVYFLDDQPECIVGHYLSVNGFWGPDDADAIENNNAEYVIDLLKKHSIVYFTRAARNMLMWVQHFQDRGESWGNALDHAIACVKRDVEPGSADIKIAKAISGAL